MLYDFHATENKTAPGSVHATYLLSGYRRIPANGGGDVGEDVEMSLSPWESVRKAREGEEKGEEEEEGHGEDEGPAMKVVTIVPQEKLEGLLLPSSPFPPLLLLTPITKTYQPTEAKQSFTRLVSVHVYSLASAKLTVPLRPPTPPLSPQLGADRWV